MIFASVSGRLGKDSEIKYTASGTMLLAFTVASDHGWGDNKHTNWVNCTIWGNRAEKLEAHLKKGTAVTVHGELDKREWESNGKSGSALEVKVSELVFTGGKNDQQQSTNAGNSGGQSIGFRETKVNEPPQTKAFDDDSDIPF